MKVRPDRCGAGAHFFWGSVMYGYLAYDTAFTLLFWRAVGAWSFLAHHALGLACCAFGLYHNRCQLALGAQEHVVSCTRPPVPCPLTAAACSYLRDARRIWHALRRGAGLLDGVACWHWSMQQPCVYLIAQNTGTAMLHRMALFGMAVQVFFESTTPLLHLLGCLKIAGRSGSRAYLAAGDWMCLQD
jgi:hypothetical protein